MRTSAVWLVRCGVAAVIIGGVVLLVVALGPPPTEQTTGGEAWTCSMHPQVRLPQAGRCPICGMNLIPVAQLAEQQSRIQQQAGLETEAVKHRQLFKEIRTVGKLDYNESRVALITARIAGRVDRVFADFTGIQVKKHDHLVNIYSPGLYVAQAELIRSLQAFERQEGDQRFNADILEAARTKLRLLGILPEQIANIEKNRKELTHLTIYAPIGGIVIEKNIREQQYVQEGDMLYRIADLDPIWLYLDIYEYDLGWIRYGQQVDVAIEAYPGESFRGTVVFIDPFLDDKTRTVRVRVNLKNPLNKLKPAMYASASIHVRLRSDGAPDATGLEGKYICPMHPDVVLDEAGRCKICDMPLEKVPDLYPDRRTPPKAVRTEPKAAKSEPKDEPQGCLALPKSAVLDTGRRQVAYRQRDDGAFELVDLRLGALAEAKDDKGSIAGYYPVLAGLEAGDKVVVRGGFLLDSQRQIEGMPSLLYSEGRSAASLHAGHGGGPSPMPDKTRPATGQPAPPAHQH